MTTLPLFAQDREGVMAAFKAERLDVGANGLGGPEPVQGQQGDEGVLDRRPEAGGDEQGTDFVTVQAHGVGLVVQARAPDVNCR